MNFLQIFGVIFFALAFLLSGYKALSKRSITIAFRAGTSRPSSIWIFTNTAAIIYGTFAVAVGSILFLAGIALLLKKIEYAIFIFILPICIATFIVGLGASLFVQFLENNSKRSK